MCGGQISAHFPHLIHFFALNRGVFTKNNVAKEFTQFGSIFCKVIEAVVSFTILKDFGVTSWIDAPTVLISFGDCSQ